MEQIVTRIGKTLMVAGCLVGSAVGAGILLFLATPDLCGNTIGEEIVSPGGKWKAVIFERDCGATTDFSTQISLLKARQSLPHDSAGNVFTADSNRGKVGVDVNGIMPMDLKWNNENELLIRYPAGSRVFSQLSEYKGVQLKYVADENLR